MKTVITENTRVSRPCLHHNSYKHGTVIRSYSRPTKKIGNLVLGPYPQLYDVRWDDGRVGTYLPHGIQVLE